MTQTEFDRKKDEIMEEIVLHRLDPEHYTAPRLTQEEIAILWAKDKDDIKSKMAICKFEAKTLAKLKVALSKYGINSLDDAMDLGGMREVAKSTNTREY